MLRGTLAIVFMVLLSLVGCHQLPDRQSNGSSIVGTWLVTIPEAPFPYHLFVFHADKTVQQANPDAGDPNTSDTNAMGAWTLNGDRVEGKVVEIMADRTSHRFASRGEITFSLVVAGDVFRGTATANFYDMKDRQLRNPVAATLEGKRISP